MERNKYEEPTDTLRARAHGRAAARNLRLADAIEEKHLTKNEE